MSRSTVFAVLGAAMLLAGCNDIPDFRRGERLSRPFTNPFSNPFSRDPATAAPETLPGAVPSAAADVAEGACIQAGTAAGFEVQGVVGTREVTDAAGAPVSRDVMLSVRRGGQALEVRCSYAYASASARMMTL